MERVFCFIFHMYWTLNLDANDCFWSSPSFCGVCITVINFPKEETKAKKRLKNSFFHKGI